MLEATIVDLSTTIAKVFTARNGVPGAPVGVLLVNNDPSETVYVGGEQVTVSTGIPIASGASLSMDLIASEEIWALSGAGTPEIRILQTQL